MEKTTAQVLDAHYAAKIQQGHARLGEILGVDPEQIREVSGLEAGTKPRSSENNQVAAATKPDGIPTGLVPPPAFVPNGRNKDYYLCQVCGEPFWRRQPDPRLIQANGDDPASCPACGAREGDTIKDPETGKDILTATGNPLQAVWRIRNSSQREAWNKAWAKSRRQLPVRTAHGQHVKMPANFIRDVWPALTMVQRSLVVILALLTDAKTGFAAVGTRTLALYCKPVNRSGPLDNRTVREALRGMETINIKIYRESTQTTEDVPILTSQKIGRSPTRYWLRMGD